MTIQNSKLTKCQNCDKEFAIEPEDFAFYEKIRVPPPTWCPECRLVRRMIIRNDRVLYKRVCDSCGKNIFSIYKSDSFNNIYCKECWWSDKWNPMTAGREYNLNKPFFEQLKWLIQKVPSINLFNGGTLIDSDYCNYASNVKNCYLFIAGKNNENVLYSNRIFFSNDSVDTYIGSKLELCYEDVQCVKSYRLFFSRNCENCNDSVFLYDCRHCQNCFGCVNLRNKEYHIFNEPHSKESYLAEINKFNLGSYHSLENLKNQFDNFYRKNAIHRYAHLINAVNSTGDYLFNTKNCQHCFDNTGSGSEDCKYTHYVGVGVKDSYDNYGMPQAERVYETIAIGFESNENTDYRFSYFVKGSNNVDYSCNCIFCHNLFGCIGLRNKEYCILNNQYTKQEYEALVPKIIRHMNEMPYADKKGRVYKYGEFFPPELSPFSYNETIAQEYFPLTKEQALDQGYSWKDPEERNLKLDFKSTGFTRPHQGCKRFNNW